jgi:hemerythrin
MVSNILEAAKDYNEGKHFVPNHFVRTLRDWVFSHIALSDHVYAAYIHDLKKKGLLNDRQIALYLQG